MAWESIDLPGAEIALDRTWLPVAEADALFASLLDTVDWQTHWIRLFGREVASPRLSCWIGDPDAAYAYSGTRFEPHPWPESLMAIRHRAGDACDATFNSVLANLYRDGRDAMGWHRDDERELGPEPVIASLSLGDTRRFLLKPVVPSRHDSRTDGTDNTRASGNSCGRSLAVELSHGSLLLMRGPTQRCYRHAVPRTRKSVGPRINLTFRRIGL